MTSMTKFRANFEEGWSFAVHLLDQTEDLYKVSDGLRKAMRPPTPDEEKRAFDLAAKLQDELDRTNAVAAFIERVLLDFVGRSLVEVERAILINDIRKQVTGPSIPATQAVGMMGREMGWLAATRWVRNATLPGQRLAISQLELAANMRAAANNVAAQLVSAPEVS